PSAAAAQGAPRSARPAAGELRARKPEPLAPMPPILRPHSTLCAALSSVPHSILLAAGGGHDVPSSSQVGSRFALIPNTGGANSTRCASLAAFRFALIPNTGGAN